MLMEVSMVANSDLLHSATPSPPLPTPREVLEFIPQKAPFRFVDEILEVDELKIKGRVTFRKDEPFYQGHFPGNPITPGVILLEAMCQIGIVAHGVYLFALENLSTDWKREAVNRTTLFSDAKVEFFHPVYPGETLQITADRSFWRFHKLKSVIQMHRDGVLVAECVASGIGVKNVQKK